MKGKIEMSQCVFTLVDSGVIELEMTLEGQFFFFFLLEKETKSASANTPFGACYVSESARLCSRCSSCCPTPPAEGAK